MIGDGGIFGQRIRRQRTAEAIGKMTDQQLRELYDELDAREFSFTDADVDTMTDIRAEQLKRQQSLT